MPVLIWFHRVRYSKHMEYFRGGQNQMHSYNFQAWLPLASSAPCRGVARNLFWGIKVFGGIKLLNSRSDVILPHKKFTCADFGGVNTHIPPVATPLAPCYI